jgi:hypothetical protein
MEMKMIVENWCNDIDSKKQNTLKKPFPVPLFPAQTAHVLA